MKKLVVFCISLVFLTACSRSFDGGYNLPLLYKIDVQQGNVIEQEMLDKLKPGMDKNQVKFIMGTPVLIDPFHNERWEYIYSYQKGGGVREQRHVTLHFEEDKLAYISGDIEVSNIPRAENEIISEEEAIVVPKTKKEKKGFFGRLLNKINPLDDEDVSNVPRVEDEIVIEEEEEVVIVTEEEAIADTESNAEEEGFFSRMLDKLNPPDDE